MTGGSGIAIIAGLNISGLAKRHGFAILYFEGVQSLPVPSPRLLLFSIHSPGPRRTSACPGGSQKRIQEHAHNATTRESYPGLKAQTIEEPPGASPFDHVRLQPISPPAAAGPWLLAPAGPWLLALGTWCWVDFVRRALSRMGRTQLWPLAILCPWQPRGQRAPSVGEGRRKGQSRQGFIP